MPIYVIFSFFNMHSDRMNLEKLEILLADDDLDDCLFFREAVAELEILVRLTATHDGEQLMEFLNNTKLALPHVLFLDLNMPRKNGFECLAEIKNNLNLIHLPVIVFSTSFEQDVVNQLYLGGAQFFIRKPANFSQFKKIIKLALSIIATGKWTKPNKDFFVLTVHDFERFKFAI
jgi:CheY-like chemotaxis protein